MRKGISIILLLWISNIVLGQKNIIHQNLIWYGVFSTLNLNEKWYIQNEFQERHFVDPLAQHQFLIRSHLHRVLGKSGWEASVGMCLFLQNPNDPNAVSNLTVPELRPHIEFAYKQKWNRIAFDHRYRTEARFFHNTDFTRTSLEDGFDFGNLRFRYRFQATIPLLKIKENTYFKLKLSDEIHLNAGTKITKNVFEQNRIYSGVSYDILPKVTLDAGYLNWFQQSKSGDFYNRNIWRFVIFHKMNLYKSKKQ